MAYNEIEALFISDIREKKQAGRGAFAKTGKGVKHTMNGALRTPYHFMSTKERKKLNGKVEVTKMYETVIPKMEFDLKDKETQRAMMIRWREIYPNNHIMEAMGISGSGSFHNIIKELEIPRKTRHGGIRKKNPTGTSPKPKKVDTKKEHAPMEQAPENTPIVNNFVQQPVKLITNGLHLEYNGKFSAEQITKIFTKLQLLVDGEENNFNIELSITEIEKKKDIEEGQPELTS